MTFIYKIINETQWQNFQKDKIFEGDSLDLESGFIHCSTKSQYPRIREKFFKDQTPTILLTIDEAYLPEGALKMEANRPGGDTYPHLYGPLPLGAVISVERID